MRAPPTYLRSNSIVYSLKVVKSYAFAADKGNTDGERDRVRWQKGREASVVLHTERSEPWQTPAVRFNRTDTPKNRGALWNI